MHGRPCIAPNSQEHCLARSDGRSLASVQGMYPIQYRFGQDGHSSGLKWKKVQSTLTVETYTGTTISIFVPANIKYFIDPYQVIGNYRSCSLNKNKLNMDSYKFGVIWKYINYGDNLNGAHDSMVDTKAQTDIIINKIFIPFINHSSSVQLISDIFSKISRKMDRGDGAHP